MSAVTYAERCTQAQRDYIRTLLARCELAVERFTYSHRPVFAAARLPEPEFGGSVDLQLRDLDKAQASRLIAALESRAGIDHEEDD
ncbi:MAG TPA: hypothetical protein VGE09_09215 [Pseudoxanthomonas sp.]|nr:MAG: hypothetical protein ABS98_00425 [Xanthomonadaceae bacterium SCN 69-48]